MHIFFILFTIHLIVNAFCRFYPFFLFVGSDRKSNEITDVMNVKYIHSWFIKPKSFLYKTKKAMP